MKGAPQQHGAAEQPASFAARGRFRVVQWLRAVPIRWRILSIAALNSAVVVVLAVLIWNGAKVLGSAWDDVRQVRRVRQDPGATGKRDRPAAEPDPPLHQPAEPGTVRRNPAAARSRARHPHHARRRPTRCCQVRSSGSNTSPTASSTALANCARVQATITKTYETAGAGPGQGNGRALFDHRGRHRASRRADLARARKIPRGVYGHAGRGQRLLPVAGHRPPPRTPAGIPRRSRRPSL